MPRGGDRSAQAKAAGKRVGRPPKAKVETPAGTKGIATHVLAKIDEEFYWLLLLHWDEMKAAIERIKENPKDQVKIIAALRETIGKSECAQIGQHLERLTNRRDGTAPQRIDTAFNPETPLRVIIDHIGRPQDQAATKAKLARGPVE
jgi:hypothetical protein